MSANCPTIYFMDLRGDATHVRVGFDGSARIEGHIRMGQQLLAAMPGSKDFEERIHAHFRNRLSTDIPNQTSIYSHDDVWNYVEWLLARGYATNDPASIEHIQPALWDLIDPAKTRPVFALDASNRASTGQALLLPKETPPTRRARVARAAKLAQHLSQSDEWYTPPYVIDAARKVMGTIDLDPASCPVANKVVMAPRYYSQRIDGLLPDHPWEGNVWMNPPYGGMAKSFLNRLVKEFHGRSVLQAIVLLPANSAATHWMDPVFDTSDAIALTRGRIQFIAGNGQTLGQQAGGGTIFGYWGPNADAFASVFRDLRPPQGDQGPSGCRILYPRAPSLARAS